MYPQLKLKIFGMTAKFAYWEKTQQVLQAVPKVVSKFQCVFLEANWKLHLRRKSAKESKSKPIVPNKFLQPRRIWPLRYEKELCVKDNVV